MKRALLLLVLTGCGPVVVDFGGDKPGDTGGEDSVPDTIVSGAISVSPGGAELGLVFVGETVETSFTISNVGDGAVKIATALASSHDEAWSYTLTTDAPAPGASSDLVVTLTPTTWGDHGATLAVADTAGSGGSVELVIDVDVQVDADGDRVGSAPSGGTDCDDTDATVFPGAPDEWYDGVDSDCAGDDDFDQDGDGVLVDADCDDTDASVYPGALDDWYDGVDSDCAGNDDFDQDADGHAMGADCDDLAPDVFPGAAETWYDGVDSDCDGADDYDQDGDGYQLAEDCDDVDATINPGATDTWYDGIDSNCAGDDDYDQDADGVDSPDDCDDTDAAVGAPTTEAWNAIDDDCDGVVDDLVVTDVEAGTLYGATLSLGLGAQGSMALGGDVDDDGTDDLVGLAWSTGGGSGWLVSGASAVGAAGVIGDYDRAALSGSTAYGLAYVQGPLQDLTGDASADVLVGAVSSYYGAGGLLDGDSAVGAVNLSTSPTAYFVGDGDYDLLKWAVGGDVDGDGVAEVVTGAILDSYGSSWSTEYYTGNIAVFSDSDFSGGYDLDDADDQIHGAASFDYLGTAVAIADVTGDGYGDILAGASGYDGDADDAGAVHLFLGNASLAWANDRADVAALATISGTTASMALGGQAIPTPTDLTGDAIADIVVAASGSGAAWVFTDVVGLSGEVDVTEADAIVSGTAASFATAVAVDDLDGDGIGDLAIGASGDDTAFSNAGAVFLYMGGGAWTTSMTHADADAAVYGAASGDALGSGLAAGGDLDGDLTGDLLLGASGADGGASNGGAIYVLLGR